MKTLTKQKNKTLLSRKSKIVLWGIFVVFFLYSITLLYPLVWMTMNSFKEKFEYLKNVFSLPDNWIVQNYIDALNLKVSVGGGASAKQIGIPQMFLNSIIVTVTTTVLEVFFSASAAYVVAKYNFKGRSLVFGLVIVSMVVPIVGTLPAMYQFMRQTKLLNTLPGLHFIYVSGFGFGFLLLNGHFRNLSWSYAEAAQIDGAGDFRVFFTIMIPLSIPALTALSIITAIGYWNDFATQQIYLFKMPTISVGINQVMNEFHHKSEFPKMFASMMLAVVPIIIFFVAFQKVIMQNMVTGGLKG